MSGLGYFMQSLGQGLMSRPKEDKLSRERFEYQKDQDSKAQARAIVEQERKERLRAYYKTKLSGLIPEIAETDFPAGSYQSMYENRSKQDDVVADNKNFGLLTGLLIPKGASLSDDLLKTGVDLFKHKNPQPQRLSGDAGNAALIQQIAQNNPALANQILDYTKQIKQSGATKNITHINQHDNYKMKKAYDYDFGKYEKTINKGEDAKKQIFSIQALRSIPLDTDGDPLVGMKNTIAKYANSFGVPVDVNKINDIEKAKSITNRLALDVLADFKGATSERELEFSKDTTVKLTQPQETRKWLMDVQEAKALWDMEKSKFYEDFRAQNDGDVSGVASAWNKHKRTLPVIFGRTPKDKKPLTWYAWKRGIVEYYVSKGMSPPSQQELIEEWNKTHVPTEAELKKYGGVN